MFENRRYPDEISRLIVKQLGYVTREQLRTAGVHPSWIERHIQLGDLIAVHAGVYAVGHVPRHAHCRSMAAVLACGPDAVLSHGAAVALYGLGEWPAILHVTAPRQRRRPGIETHRSATLARRDVRRQHGIPVTSPVRTVLDVQAQKTDAGLTRLINDARNAGLLRPAALRELMARSERAARAIDDPRQRPTRSELEDLFRRFCRRHRLPMPLINAIIAELDGREVDAFYPEHRLIVELDSWKFHQSRAKFERDRELDAEALADGFETVRITQRRLERGGAREAARIRKILARRERDRD